MIPVNYLVSVEVLDYRKWSCYHWQAELIFSFEVLDL